MQNLLEVKDLKMHFSAGASGLFGGKKNYVYAVDGVNFTLKKGETLGLVGVVESTGHTPGSTIGTTGVTTFSHTGCVTVVVKVKEPSPLATHPAGRF